MTHEEQIRWQLGLIVFRALTATLQIDGVDRRQIARAFLMAAETLMAEPEITAGDADWPASQHQL